MPAWDAGTKRNENANREERSAAVAGELGRAQLGSFGNFGVCGPAPERVKHDGNIYEV